MAKKSFEMSFQIGGKLASSFSSVFSKASTSLQDLKNQARQTQRALDQLGSDFRKGKIHQSQYAEATERLTKELEQLERAQNRIKAMQTTFSNGLNTTKQVAGIAAVGTAAAATGLAFDSLNTAADFQQQMTKVGVIAGASSSELKKLNDTALDLGASSSLSASEVAVAMKELASKGMDTNKIVGAIPGILAAAEASGEDLALTSNVVVSALNAFELEASKASHIADVMAMSANKSAAGVEDLGYSFKYAAPVVKTLGISLEELAASTGIMVDKGLTGEQAGTSLRMALVRLSDPPKEAKKALDKLGISVTDKNKKFKSMAKISEEWNQATKNLTQTQKVQYAATIFGTEAATGMLNIFSAGPEKINEMTKALENSAGSAKEAAKAVKDNYAGSLDQLKGSIETAKIKFATPILPVFQDLFDGLGSMLDRNMGWIEKSGEKVAAGLKDIFEPFSTQKPEKPKFEDVGNRLVYQEMMDQYQKDLAKFNKFNSMDFGDKVVYMLDEATAKIEKWLSGPGGESMNKIFTKLGEIAAKAWIAAFTGTVKSSASNLFQGNFAASLGMGAAAWMMGGGLLAKGAIGAGKWGYNKVKSAKGAKVPQAVATPAPKSAPASTPKSGKVVQFPATKAVSSAPSTPAKGGIFSKFPKISGEMTKTTKVLGSTGKLLGKVALPLTIASEAYSIYKAKDKTKATVQAGTGIAGGLGGAKFGALAGSLAGPIGTAVGSVLGGLVGYGIGKFAGGKAVDSTRAAAQATPTNAAAVQADPGNIGNTNAAAINSATQALAANINSASHNFSLLTMYTGMASGQIAGPSLQLSNDIKSASHNFSLLTMYSGMASGWLVGAFTGIKTSADSVKHNLDLLTMYTGQASGWLASLSGIQSAGQRVINALNNLEARINSVQLPSVKSKRVSYDG